MYLYYNKLGKLTTVIPHGEIVRQGGNLNIYVCVDTDFFISKNSEIEDWKSTLVVYATDGNVVFNETLSLTRENVSIISFHKLISSENTLDLLNGGRYYCYHFEVGVNVATQHSGMITAAISLMKYEINEIDGGEWYSLSYLGKADIFVEKVKNNNEPLNIDLLALSDLEREVANLKDKNYRQLKVHANSDIAPNSIVKFSGYSNGYVAVEPINKDTEKHLELILGYCVDGIQGGSNGFIALSGLIKNIDTSAYQNNDTLFIDFENSTLKQGVVPYDIAYAFCTVSHATAGSIYIRSSFVGGSGRKQIYYGDEICKTTPITGDLWIEN